MKYTLAGANTVASSTLSGCTCNGAVYEVAYTVNLEENPAKADPPVEPFFTVKSVKARVATYSGAVGSASGSGSACGAALVP